MNDYDIERDLSWNTCNDGALILASGVLTIFALWKHNHVSFGYTNECKQQRLVETYGCVRYSFSYIWPSSLSDNKGKWLLNLFAMKIIKLGYTKRPLTPLLWETVNHQYECII